MMKPETPRPNRNLSQCRLVAAGLVIWALSLALACNQVQDLGEQGDSGRDTSNPGNDAGNAGADGGLSGSDADMSGDDGDMIRDADMSGDDVDMSDDDGDSADGDGDVPPVEIPPVTLTSQEVCMQLLTCADQQTPSQFAQLFPVYGTNGSCWGEHSEQECRQGCVDALRTLYDRSSDGCKYCEDDASCPALPNTGNAGICHPAYHECSECATDQDCTSEYSPVCSLTYNQCVACAKDSDCDVAECSVDANTCEGIYCKEQFNKFVTLTIRGSGLEQFELGNHLSYSIYETLDGCGTHQFDHYLKIVNGGFEIVRDDIVATTVTLVVDIWQDGVGGFKYLRENVDLTKSSSIELHAADFVPEN